MERSVTAGRSRRSSGNLGVLLAGVCVLGLAQAHTGRAEPPVIPVSAELVMVDAVVVDAQGRHVTDLEAEDFELREDRKRRPITHFQYVSVDPPATVSPPPLVAAVGPKPPERSTTRRTLAIVLDDLSLSFEGHAWARPALRRLVDERLDDGDLVSVVQTGGGIGNLQQFTNDKRLLTAAIDGLPF